MTYTNLDSEIKEILNYKRLSDEKILNTLRVDDNTVAIISLRNVI